MKYLQVIACTNKNRPGLNPEQKKIAMHLKKNKTYYKTTFFLSDKENMSRACTYSET
jgi:hypothetical protein